MSLESDLYAILGVSPLATQEEIKRAHRALARRFHPDSGTDEASAERFREIEEAYRVLGDPLRRRAYDKRRTERGPDDQPLLTWSIVASRDRLPALDEEQTLYVLAEIRPVAGITIQRLPLNLCLVIDCSTSMDGERLNYVKAVAHQIIDDLEERDALSLVAFNDRAEVLMPSQKMEDRGRAHARVTSIWAGGGTEILQGLTAGLEQVRRLHHAEVISHLILLTDGRTYGDEEQCIAEARRAGLERIGISAVGIGEDWNDAFLDNMVHQADGVAVYVAHPQQIRNVLLEQVRRLGTIFAQQLRLNLRLSDRVRLESVFRATPHFERLPFRQESVSLGMLQSGIPLQVLLELVVAPLTPGRHRLAQFELLAEVPAVQRQERLIADLASHVVAGPVPDTAAAPIINVLSRLSIFRMQEQVWNALERGEPEKAQQRLEQIATRLLDVGETELAHMALLEAGRVARSGVVSEKGHKTLKYGTRSLGFKR